MIKEEQLLPKVDAAKVRHSHRIDSIDLLRGIVIIIMALDHSRQYFGYGTLYANPTDLSTTTPFLFFTRWITHFCAPVFVFLAGTSAYLYGSKKQNKKDLSIFLLTRGFWLILLEITVVNFGFLFDISFSIQVFQVIWAIGVSMMVLSFVVYLPKIILLIAGLVIVAGHNIFDSIQTSGNGFSDILWYMLHQRNIFIKENTIYFFMYPVLPWIGVMILGYLFGELYRKDFNAIKRKKMLMLLGFGSILLFIILRSFNIYGDSSHWHIQKNFLFSILSFINTTKYPPSLLFLLMTLGPAFLVLRYTENFRNQFSEKIVIFGRVPLFFYITHIFLYHLAALIAIVLVGRPIQDAVISASTFINETLSDFGFDLWVTYVVWIAGVLILYPFCRNYNSYKTRNKDKKWLSYL